MTKKIFKYAKRLLPLIGIIIFVYLIYRLDIEDIIDAISQISPFYIVLSLVLTIPVVIFRNYAWQLILKEQKIEVSFLTSLKILLIGYFYGTITPGYLGQVMRVPYLKERTGDPYGKIFINVFIETAIRTLSLYVMMVVGALLIIGLFPELFHITFAWIVIFTIILLYFIKKERGEKLLCFLIQYFIPKRAKSHFNRFVDTFYQDFPKIRKLIFPLFLGGFTWIIIFTQEYLIVLGLGLDIPYFYFLLLFPIANTAGFIPITFAGLGTRELTAIFIFSTLFFIAEEKIFVLSILGFLITDISISFIGFLLSLTETRKEMEFPPIS